MKFKGTKGKWIVRDEKNSNGFINIDLPNNRFITFYGKFKKINDVFPEETKANALLISKAPEMLQLLKNTYLHIDALSRAIKDPTYSQGIKSRAEEIKQLIKEATEL